MCICSKAALRSELYSDAFQDRISRFRRKVSKVNSENMLKNSNRVTEVNIQAANRFITAAIPELSIQQKQALRQVCNLFSSDLNCCAC